MQDRQTASTPPEAVQTMQRELQAFTAKVVQLTSDYETVKAEATAAKEQALKTDRAVLAAQIVSRYAPPANVQQP